MTIAEYAKGADIFSLSVPKLEYVFFEENLDSKSKLLYSYTPVIDEVEIIQKSSDIIVHFPMEFSAVSKQDHSVDFKEEDLFFKLSVEFRIVFRSKNKIKVSKQIKKEIVEQLVPRIIHPYFRLTISESLQKAGLPPLQIPLIESLEDDDLEVL